MQVNPRSELLEYVENLDGKAGFNKIETFIARCLWDDITDRKTKIKDFQAKVDELFAKEVYHQQAKEFEATFEYEG